MIATMSPPKKTQRITVLIDPRIFNPVYFPYLKCDTIRTQIFFGGSSSGKSVFLARRCVLDVAEGGRNYLIVRNVASSIKKSVFNEVVKAIRALKLSAFFTINKTDMEITCLNGYQILFSGLDDVEKIKSMTPAVGVLTDIWVEEATETDRRDIMQLRKRLRGLSGGKMKRLILSFNPVLQTSWIYEMYFQYWDDSKTLYISETLLILKTTYKDNKFLAPDDIKDLEDETDPYFYAVYTLGNWGVLGEVIYRNWRVEVFSEEMMAQMTNHKHGLDFGFSKDPAAMPCTHYDRKNKTIYVYDELYQTQLTNDVLAREIKKRINNDPVVCDSAEPKSIKELRQHDVQALSARKGKDSVHHGIQWLQQQTIVINRSCQNFKNEIQSYQWQTDKDDHVLPVPVDKNDHLMDALRYAYENEYREFDGPVTVRM